MNRIVLGCSSERDASVAIPWLRSHHDADVVTLTVDFGQGGVEEIRNRALAAGAVRAHVLDLREELLRDYMLPALRAAATDRDGRPLVSLGRPLIAAKLVEIATMEGAQAVAHGCPGPRPCPLENLLGGLDSSVAILAPVRESGQVQEPEVISSVVPARRRSSEPAHLDVSFDAGRPSAINGVSMPLIELVGSVNVMAAAYGIGGSDAQNRVAASRQVYALPAATVLHVAHAELQRAVMSPDLDAFLRSVSARYSRILEDGLWFTPVRQALDVLIDRFERGVTGLVRVKLVDGTCSVVRSDPQRLSPSEQELESVLSPHASTRTSPRARVRADKQRKSMVAR